jgi:DNA (cytosine-5)-methyltransferase 1
MTVGSLFAGIGGFDLGLERAGMRVAWQCEIDPDARAILAKHWPKVPCYGDIRRIDWSTVEPVDVICGGYPCQPFSCAGKREGEFDERHLWPEVARCVRHLRPRWVLLENVSGHLSLGFGSVLGDLAALGYDAFWDCIPAAAVGAPHLRDRVFVVAWRVATDARGKPRTERTTIGRASKTSQSARSCDVGSFCSWNSGPPVSPIRRMDDGIPARLDAPRLRGLGNAIVPQIPEMLGRIIVEVDRCS